MATVLRQQEAVAATLPDRTGLAQSGAFTPAQRWEHYLHRTYAPSRLGLLAADTAFAQAVGDPACWDRGANSYARRYLRSFDRRVIRNTAELGAGLLTGEDLRYQRSRSGLLPSRFWNAVRSAFVARMPNGAERPAYTRFGATAVAESATAHWVGRPVQPGWVAQSLAWAALDQVQTNLLDEFGPDLRRAGGRLWKRVRHLPQSAITSPQARH